MSSAAPSRATDGAGEASSSATPVQGAPSSAAAEPPIRAERAQYEAKAKDLQGNDRIDDELVRKELSLADLVTMMDEYKPLVPDAVTDYYLTKAGFNCDDVRVKRVLALAAQKFIADVATDALHFCRLRQQSAQGRKPNKKHMLTIEDLSSALAEYGISVRKPEYFS